LGFRNIVVSDIERARNLWAKLLGLNPQPIIATENWKPTQMSFRSLPSTGKANFKLKHIVLEIIQSIEFPEKHGEGIYYVAFVTDDADESGKMLLELDAVEEQKSLFKGGGHIYLDAGGRLGQYLSSYIIKGMNGKHTMGCLDGVFCS